MQDPEVFITLLKGHLDNTLTPGQLEEFLDALNSGSYREILGDEILMHLAHPPHPGQDLSTQTKTRIMDRVLRKDNAPGFAGAPVVPIHSRKRWLWAAAAASLIALVSITFLYRSHTNGSATGSGQALVAANNGDKILPVSLEDGSTIELRPGSKLSYPEHFTGGRREVQLEGSAFFRIAADPQHPFYAQSRGLVTHVLGTSFSIDWDQHQQELKVAVRTGKVEVHPRENENISTVLTPNQQILYTEGSSSLTPALVDSPWLINSGKDLIFKAAPVSQVFAQLKESYGIDIVPEKEEIGKKQFTGDLSHLSFYIALKIICLSLNHSYVVRGTKVVII